MYDAILVPTDGSEWADAAGAHAIELAKTCDATVHVLHVVDVRMTPISPDMDPETVEGLLDESDEDPTASILDRASEAGVRAVEAVRVGVPHEEIRTYAEENAVDLVVMGTHGRTGLDRYLLGSVTERVVRTVDAPVLTIHRDE